MLPRLFLIILVIALIFFLIGKYQQNKHKFSTKDKRKFLFWGAIAIVILAVASGRMHWIGILFAALLGVLRFGMVALARIFPFLRLIGAHTGNPKFTTKFLSMKLDFQSGSLGGKILSGPYEGADLEELDATQLQELIAHYHSEDKRSWLLLRSYMIRHGHEFAEKSDNGENRSTGTSFSREEALKILGLEDPINKTDIVTAHKKLMQKVHPDKGGNDFLASQVNQAKELLLSSIQD